MVLSNLTSPVFWAVAHLCPPENYGGLPVSDQPLQSSAPAFEDDTLQQHLLHRLATTALQRKPSRIVTRKPGQTITQTALTEMSSLFRLLALPLWNCLRAYRVRSGPRRRRVPSSRDGEKET